MASPAPTRPKIFLLYHFMHPDPVISAKIYDELGQYLSEKGWDVTAFPANRGFRNPKETHAPHEKIGAVEYRRISRPSLSQHSNLGRLVNCSWMIARWSLLGLQRPDVVVVGTDPAFGVLSALGIKTFSAKTKVAQWCFDLYPEAPIAQGMIYENSGPARGFRALVDRAYKSCDLLVDIGPCMRERLETYTTAATRETLTPWALVEPAAVLPVENSERAALFGDAKLGLLYSGSLGQAHSFKEFLELAQLLKNEPIRLAFAASGPRTNALTTAISHSNAPISTHPAVEPAQLESRLAAADVHLVSMRNDWAGVVIPSKFFASLAIGRPVLFAGPESSSIARWIREYEIGWVLTSDNRQQLAAQLRAYTQDLSMQKIMQARCHVVYQKVFRKELILQRWETALRALLPH